MLQDGKTPLDYADEQGHSECVLMMLGTFMATSNGQLDAVVTNMLSKYAVLLDKVRSNPNRYWISLSHILKYSQVVSIFILEV